MDTMLIKKGEIFPNTGGLERYRNVDVGSLLEWNNGFSLIYLINSPSQDEITDVEKGEARIKVYEYKKSIFLLSRFGECGSDSTFNSRRLPKEQQESLKKLGDDLQKNPQNGISFI